RSRAATAAGRRFQVSWCVAWTLAVGLSAGALALAGPGLPDADLAALGAIGAAGLVGAVLAQVGDEAGATGAILIWALAGAAAALLTGGTAGPLAAWCLTPLAAAAAFGRPKLLALG